MPRAERIGAPVEEGIGYDRVALAEAAARLNLRLLPTPEVRQVPDIEAVFEAMRRDGAQAYFSIGGVLIHNAREQVAALALRHRLPGMHFSADDVRACGLRSSASTSGSSTGARPGSWRASWPAPSRPSCRWSSRRASSPRSTCAPAARALEPKLVVAAGRRRLPR
ncbi:MAG: hypothetical protein U5J78_03450 [Parasphingorhabdus sp.]|nr:hypothetical protein [Parasphingorhabdus sp.]